MSFCLSGPSALISIDLALNVRGGCGIIYMLIFVPFFRFEVETKLGVEFRSPNIRLLGYLSLP